MSHLDHNTFKHLFKEYYNPLCNFASSIINDKLVAQDIVQDVFAKIWHKRDDIELRSEYKSYLFSAVKNRSLEILRKAKLDAKVASNLAEMGAKIDVNKEADSFVLKEQLYNSIRQLPTKCQEVFVLNKIEGLSYVEVANKLGISVKTVENHIGKAFRILRTSMSDKWSVNNDNI